MQPILFLEYTTTIRDKVIQSDKQKRKKEKKESKFIGNVTWSVFACFFKKFCGFINVQKKEKEKHFEYEYPFNMNL